MNDNLPIVSFKNVSKWYDQFQALDHINLDLKKGEKMVICGPSGSGKSTLIRCINALETHEEGAILVNNIEVGNNLKDLSRIRQSVGMVFQHFNLFPHLTVLENLMLAPVHVKKLPKAEAEELAHTYLKRVKLSNQFNKYSSQLSGGQQQRVAIARSLCMQPEIMLFDEPTSALDPELIKEVLDILEVLANEGMTMMLVSHEMAFARQIADQMVFMEYGKIVEINKPDRFFTNPQEQRTKVFLSQILGHK
jgi:general L-amino acid transport system ATP-binding protein